MDDGNWLDNSPNWFSLLRLNYAVPATQACGAASFVMHEHYSHGLTSKIPPKDAVNLYSKFPLHPFRKQPSPRCQNSLLSSLLSYMTTRSTSSGSDSVYCPNDLVDTVHPFLGRHLLNPFPRKPFNRCHCKRLLWMQHGPFLGVERTCPCMG